MACIGSARDPGEEGERRRHRADLTRGGAALECLQRAEHGGGGRAEPVRDDAPRGAVRPQQDRFVVVRGRVAAGGGGDDDRQHLLASRHAGGKRRNRCVPRRGDNADGVTAGAVDARGEGVQREVVAHERRHRMGLPVVVGET